MTSELEEAVYANPLADGPRLALAESSTERGEFIELQLSRLAGRADDRSRARELALLDPMWIRPAAVKTCGFHRGFPAHGIIVPRALDRAAGDPAWATYETLDVPWAKLDAKARKTLLTIVNNDARGLRALIGVPTTFIAEISPARLAGLERLEHVRVDSVEPLVRWLAATSRARCLGVLAPTRRDRQTGEESVALEVSALEPLRRAPGFERLETLVVYNDGNLNRWLGLGAPITATELDELRIEVGRDRGTISYRGSGRFPDARIARVMRMVRRKLEMTVDARTIFVPGMVATAVAPTNRNARTLTGYCDDVHELRR